MITPHRSEDRHCDRRHQQEAWLTFHPRRGAGPPCVDSGDLGLLDEHRLPPGADIPGHLRHDAEILTTVRQGSNADHDSLGSSGVVHEAELRAWLDVVQGEGLPGGVVLGTGDVAGISVDRAASLTGREQHDVLLLGLGDRRAGRLAGENLGRHRTRRCDQCGTRLTPRAGRHDGHRDQPPA